MKFQELAQVFAQLEQTSSRNTMTEILAQLLKKTGNEEIKQLVYLAMGTLRPKFDRLEFALADKMVVRALQHAYGKTEIASIEEKYKELGDLGEVVIWLGRKFAGDQVSSGMTVAEVYDELTRIAQEKGKGSQERKVERLARMVRGMDQVSAKYLIRIVLGKLRLGFSDKTILDALSYMEKGSKEVRNKLDAAYQIAPDPGELAKIVKQVGGDRLKENVQVKLGRPLIPALAQRLRSADEMIKKMGEVEVEPKIDGTRVQIHFSREKSKEKKEKDGIQDGLFEEEQPKYWVRSFTRNLDESTAMFPELQSIAEQIKAQEVVLDSEAVGYDPETGEMVPFQLTITRKRKHGTTGAAQKVPLRFYVFDIMYKDGQSLIELPLVNRREILHQTILGEGVLRVDASLTTRDPKEIRQYHREQLAAGFEGVMVKKAEGKYLPGRQDWNWVKFKEEEGSEGKLADTIDAVVMGYYQGKGKRQKFGVGAFLVGIRGKGEQILTIAKIGTGLSDEQFVSLFRILKSKESSSKNKAYEVAKTLTPDVWVDPELVVEIAADEVTKSPTHSSGYALRFPRLVRLREDKDLASITTKEEMKEIAAI